MRTLLFLAVIGAQAEPLSYVCKRAVGPVRVDGRLDDAAWRAAAWTAEFVDIEGDRKPKPRFRTRAKMTWDDTYFYFGAEMEEPHVWGTLTQHDAVIFRDNDFEIFLNPSGDGLNYFEFEINALNTGWDLFLARPYKKQGKADNSWEMPGLLTAVHIDGTLNDARDTDRGWSVEIAIPWTAFASRAPVRRPKTGESWRVNFSRVEWRVDIRDGKYVKLPDTKEDNWVWSPQGLIDMHVPEHWGFVKFENADVLDRVDHLVYATPDLARGIAEIEALLGVRATPGGAHPGVGTRNALVALGPSSYLEIIGPDPDQPKPAEPRPFRIDELNSSKLYTWAAKASELDALVRAARAERVSVGDVRQGRRQRPDGVALSWQRTGPGVEPPVPFFIDWGTSPHPSASAARGATLVSLRGAHPHASEVTRQLDAMGLSVSVMPGNAAALIAVIDCPKGRVELR